MTFKISKFFFSDETPEGKYHQWLLERYEETLNICLQLIETAKVNDATQAMITCMKLMAAEGKYAVVDNNEAASKFPRPRLRNILLKLCTKERSQTPLFQRFKEYAQYLDVVFNCWRILPKILNRTSFSNSTWACNYLELLNILPITKDLQEEQKMLCPLENVKPEWFDYAISRRNINKVWQTALQYSNDMEEAVHKQMLIVLLERILPHLDKPILLTDFLMDSLDCGMHEYTNIFVTKLNIL